MTPYLIEFRFSGFGKKYLKQVIYEVGRKFRVKGVTNKRVVPHITMFGPFNTNNEQKVVSKFIEICEKHQLIKFKLKGFGCFKNTKVIFADIIPSEELKLLRQELASKLMGLKDFFIFKNVKTIGLADYEEHYPFHATIAFKDINYKFDAIYHYLQNKRTPHIQQYLLRVTLLKNNRILYEYDFLQKKLLNRNEARNKDIWRKTISLLRND